MKPTALNLEFSNFFEDKTSEKKPHILNCDFEWNKGVEVSFNYHCPTTPETLKALLISGDIPFQIGIRFTSQNVFPTVLMQTISFLLKSDNCPKNFELTFYRSHNLLKCDQIDWINWCAALISSGKYPEGFLLSLWYSNIITDENAKVLFSALGSSCLKKNFKLDLTGAGIDDKHLDWLFKNLKTGTFPEGFELNLNKNERESKRKNFEDLAEKHLAQYSIETQLKELVGVGDETAQQLAIMISSGYLAKNSKVSLSHNKITDIGAETLLKAIISTDCPEDFQLDLRGNYIQRRGLITFIDTLNSDRRPKSLKISFIITVKDVDLIAAILTSSNSPAAVELNFTPEVPPLRATASVYYRGTDTYYLNDLTVHVEHNVIKLFLRIKENDHEVALELFSTLIRNCCRDLAAEPPALGPMKTNKKIHSNILTIRFLISNDGDYNMKVLQAASSLSAYWAGFHLSAFTSKWKKYNGQVIERLIDFLMSDTCPKNFTLDLSKVTMLRRPEVIKKIFERLKSGISAKNLKLDLSDNWLRDDWALELAEVLTFGGLPEHFSLLLYDNHFFYCGISCIAHAIRSGKVPFGTRVHVNNRGLEKLCIQNDARITKTAFFKIVLLQAYVKEYSRSYAPFWNRLAIEIIKHILSFLLEEDILQSMANGEEPKQSNAPSSIPSPAFFKLPLKLIVHIGEFLPIKNTLDEVVNRLYRSPLLYRHGILAGICLYSYVVSENFNFSGDIHKPEIDNSSEHVAVSDADEESGEESDAESGEESDAESDADVQNPRHMLQATGCRCNLF